MDRNRKEWGRLVFNGKKKPSGVNVHKEKKNYKILMKPTVTTQNTVKTFRTDPMLLFSL